MGPATTNAMLVCAFRICLAAEDAPQAARGAAPAEEAEKIEYSGRTFVFDYGEFAVKVFYVSDAELQWEQIKGSVAGAKAEESYHFVRVRPAVYYFSWQEKDTAVVTQVADFENRAVHTTYVSPEKKVFRMQGTIQPAAD